MTTPSYFTQYVARIIGEVDTTDLVPIDSATNMYAAQNASRSAMKDVLRTDLIDYYLLYGSAAGATNTIRYHNVPFDTHGVVISPGPTTIRQGVVPVWIEQNPDLIRFLQHRDDLGTIPLSCVPAALLFRRQFGTDRRRLDLGPSLGSIAFTPTHIEIGWRPGEPSGAGTPWYRFGYTNPGISNHVATVDTDPTFGVWLWFTDPGTGRPEADWWKVSHVLADAFDPPSARLDDPSEPPPGPPHTLTP